MKVATETPHGLPVGAKVIISDVGGITAANSEWHVMPQAGQPNAFLIERSGDPGNIKISSNGGTYTSGGTVSYGGHCLGTSGIPEIGPREAQSMCAFSYKANPRLSH